MSGWHIAVTAVFFRFYLQTLKLTVMLLTFQAGNHLINQVVYIQQFQLHTRIIDRVRLVIGKRITECRYSTIVVWPAPLTKQVRKAVNVYFCTSFLSVLQEQVFTCFLAAAVFAVAKAACETCLLAAAEHHLASIPVLLQHIQQCACKAKVALHELLLILRAVHTSQIEHKVCFCAPLVQFLRCRV